MRDQCVGGVRTCALPILTGVTVCAGDPATNLTATASGNGPFTYLVKGPGGFQLTSNTADRKSVVQGKSVDLGGRRIIKKKKGRNSSLGTARETVKMMPTP